MARCNTQALANTAWAFSTVGQSDYKLFAALGTAAEWRLGEFHAEDRGQNRENKKIEEKERKRERERERDIYIYIYILTPCLVALIMT